MISIEAYDDRHGEPHKRIASFDWPVAPNVGETISLESHTAIAEYVVLERKWYHRPKYANHCWVELYLSRVD